MSYFIVVRPLESGGSIPVGAGKDGKLTYSAMSELKMANYASAHFMRIMARQEMRRLEGQAPDFKIVEVKE